MSYLKWKKGDDGHKRLFIITNPVTVILVGLVFVAMLLPIVAFVRSLLN